MKGNKLIYVMTISLIILWCSMAVWAAEPYAIPVDSSEDGTYILLTNDFYHGLALLNNKTGKTVTVTDGRNAGYYATISGRYVAYKAFQQEGDRYLQKSMLYNVRNGKQIELTDWSPLVGTPAVADNGNIAYTIGNELFITDPQFRVLKQVNLGYHVNLLDFSQDGTQLAFNDQNGQIVVFNLNDAKMNFINSKENFWGPKFSPKGDKIMSPTVDGKTAVIEVKTGEVKSLAKGQALGWINNDTFAYLEQVIDEKEGKVIKSNLKLKDLLTETTETSLVNAGHAVVTVKGENVALARKGTLELGKVVNKRLNVWSNPLHIPAPAQDIFTQENKQETITTSGEMTIQAIYDGVYSKYLTGMPYIHQVYDTPNNFNGHWACGATSALMAIQYYGVLNAYPITVSVPYSHTSNYGWYVSNEYTYGRTFNIYGQDPNSNWFAGGYGYIIQNNWADTKGAMRDYIQYHGRGSAVDWSPTWSEAQTEINNQHPFVVLTSLTSAGHYITARGYYKNQHSLVFNDPYGNKNSGYMNYSGALVGYDWPGYNNGYANLVTVHCFIYAR